MTAAFVSMIVWACFPFSSAAQVPASATPGTTAQPQRPGAQPSGTVQPSGTAQIRGRVVDAEDGKPLRRALVRIFAAEIRENRVSSTDDQGRFEFKDLPAARYTMSASKGSYVSLSYGQTRPFESGRPLELRDAQVVEKTDFSLPRGAVVTGHVVDELGDPAPNVQVAAMRYSMVQGQKRLTTAGSIDTTNDIGEFRLYGLPPGQYYVSATPRSIGPMPSDDDRDGYAATYYPGRTNPTEAQRVTLGLGQALSDVNFALVPTRLVRVSGTAVDSKGQPMKGGLVSGLQINVVSFTNINGSLRADGTFTINGVPPGEYQLRAQNLAVPSDGLREVATTMISVADQDLTDVRLVAYAMTTATGRLVLDPSDASPVQPSAFRVMVASMPVGGVFIGFGPAVPATVSDDWTFAAKATPGKNRMSVTTPSGWSVKAVRVNGIEVTDTGIDFKPNQDVGGIEIEVTNHPATVSGMVTNGRGEPAKDYTAIVFARDEQRWNQPMARYILMSRPDQDGRFKVNAPAGDYLAVALEFVESGQWSDPDFLKQIRDRATSFSLGDGEAKTLSLKLITQP